MKSSRSTWVIPVMSLCMAGSAMAEPSKPATNPSVEKPVAVQADAKAPSQDSKAVTPQNSAPAPSRLIIASVIAPGEKVGDGDYVASSRYYGDWRLTCDEIVSKSRRVCRLEQDLAANGRWALSWRLVENAQKKPYFQITFPANANPTTGVSLIVGSFTREFKGDDAVCGGPTCEINIPADTTAQQLILGASNLRYRYAIGADVIEVSASMRGFEAALNAVSEDPNVAPVATTTAKKSDEPPEKPPARTKLAARTPERKRAPAPPRQFETIRRASAELPDIIKRAYGAAD